MEFDFVFEIAEFQIVFIVWGVDTNYVNNGIHFPLVSSTFKQLQILNIHECICSVLPG